MLVTRNHLPGSGPISRQDLDDISDIQVELEESDFAEIIDEIEDTLNTQNLLRNADFSLWARGLGPVSLAGGTWTELADYWFAKPSYAAVGSGGLGTYAAYALSADTTHQQWLYCAKLNGCAGLNNLDFGQQIPARVAAALHPIVTLTIEIENQTGSAIIPSIRLETCNTFESFTSTTLRVNTALASLANAATTVYTVTLDLTAYGAALDNGAMLYVRFPGSGMLTTATYVRVFAAKLEKGSIATTRVTERRTDDSSAPTAATVATPGINYFPNPNFHRWQSESASCIEDVPTWGPLGWFARPADGSALLMDRSTTGPDVGSRFSAQLTGDATVTGIVDFGTEIDLPTASEARAQLVFSVKIYNGSGAAITPELRIDTCDTENSFFAVTNRTSQILDPCSNAAWTTLSFAIDTTGLTNFANGAVFYLRFAAGTLDNVAKTLKIARPRLEPGTAATTHYPAAHFDEPAPVAGVYASLRAEYVSATTLLVNATDVVLKDASGKAILVPLINVTVDTATTGAAGLDYTQPVNPAVTRHFLWLISRGDVHGAILSQTTAPLLPAGYTYRARVGAIIITGSAIPRFVQLGREVALVATLAVNAAPGAPDVWQALSVANWVPDLATALSGSAGNSTNNEVRMRIAAENPAALAAAIGETVILALPATGTVYGYRGASYFKVPIKTHPNIYWMNSNSATARIEISGYTLP